MSIRVDEVRSLAWRAAWLAAVVLLLGGIFGMHGLESHGAPSLGSGDHMPMAAADSGSSMPLVSASHEAADRANTGGGGAALLDTVLGPQEPIGAGMSAAGICLAVLVLTLIALLVRIRGRPLNVMAIASRPSPPPSRRSRDPDPPSLIRLSIQRC